MFLKKLIILALTVAGMLAAYYANRFFKSKINPHGSVGRFLLFFLANLVIIFTLVLLMSYVLFRFKSFFFKV